MGWKTMAHHRAPVLVRIAHDVADASSYRRIMTLRFTARHRLGCESDVSAVRHMSSSTG